MPFYKLEDGTSLLRGDNFVISKDYELYKEQSGNYTYPVDGWWFLDGDEFDTDEVIIEYIKSQGK